MTPRKKTIIRPDYDSLTRGQREALEAQEALDFLEVEVGLNEDEIEALAIRIAPHAPSCNSKGKRIRSLMRGVWAVEKEYKIFNVAHNKHHSYMAEIHNKPLELKRKLESKSLKKTNFDILEARLKKYDNERDLPSVHEFLNGDKGDLIREMAVGHSQRASTQIRAFLHAGAYLSRVHNRLGKKKKKDVESP